MGRAALTVPVFLYLICGSYGVARVDPLVDTKVGLIKGLASTDGDYSMFLGIPYATVDPMNPFGLAIPHQGFETTFNAVDDTAICPQREEYNHTLVGTLDCLHLNIYVPNSATSKNPLPVLVYIYGGGLTIGFAGRYAQGPKYLVRHDVILVTLNYRLGVYGFFCPDIPEVPGNQGIRDQLIALRWIKNNIEAFGGDSNQITVFGESAGSTSVDILLMYTDEDLIHKAIFQSGTALLPSMFRDSDPTGPLKLAEHLGYVTSDIYQALDFLKTVDPHLVVAATEDHDIQVRLCVEKEYENVEGLIVEHPINVPIPYARKVPLLLGVTNNERGETYVDVKPEEFGNVDLFTKGRFVPRIFEFNDELLAEAMAYVRHFYIGGEDLTVDVKELLGDFVSDFDFNHATHRSLLKYIENGGNQIYNYVFSYDGDRNLIKRKDNFTHVSGALHGDELTYIFDITIFDETPTPADQLIIDRMTALWTNFAKYGNPTPEVTDLLPVEWPIATADAMHYLDIDSELTVKKRPFHNRMVFLDMFFKLYEPFLKRFWKR